jgi:hypothetical protein
MEKSSWGALVLVLAQCNACYPAKEARMEHHLHEGILNEDTYMRYCLHEPGVFSAQNAFLSLRMPVGILAQANMDQLYVEGDGENY